MHARLVVPVLLAAAVGMSTLVGCDDRPALTFAPDTLPAAHVGQRYEQQVTIGNARTPVGGISISKGRLPAGLTIEKLPGDANAGRIVGTPAAAGVASFTVSVWCFGTNTSGQTGSKSYTITVQ